MSIISKIKILIVHSVQHMKSIKLCNGNFFTGFTYLLVTIGILSGIFLLLISFEENYNVGIPIPINVVGLPDHLGTIKQAAAIDGDQSQPCNPNCSFWECFNVYRCGQRDQNRISIFVYPFNAFVDTSDTAVVLTKEYYSILEAVVHSDYYTSNPNKACLFLPSIDLLNQNLTDAHIFGKALVSLDYWENGENHLIFNMFPGRFPIFNKVLDIGTDKAIIIGGGFDSWTYRPGFDISFPVLSPLLSEFDQFKIIHKFKREHLLIVAQLNLILEQKRIFIDLAKDFTTEVLFLQSCTKVKNIDEAEKNKVTRCNTVNIEKIYKYPDVLLKGTFCFMGQSVRLGQPDFLEILAHNCIPVLLSDNYVLPFEDVIDWSLATISFRQSDLYSIVQELKAVSHIKILELQQQGQWLFQKYFNDIRTITLTALEILNDRVFPHLAKSNHHWNTIDTNNNVAHNPLFLPLISLKSQGFTAVILTYDRVESLFTLIQKLSVVSSLQSILVIWNNQRKAPPNLSQFPKVLKPLKVIQTQANKLSNRFYPYDEIETESVLTIDDDIVMLTGDELNFGFEVWREFPDRIVGFPSRVHIWDNETMRWRYESEWTNQISMVLTGVAFHHKYWSYMYTNAMPGDIKNWVDEHMNCEDIAMNFLVSYITKKPPIKVAPRKKFKCPECTNTEMLSADLSHMMERSACINRFAKIYGHMPLKTVEFRADPVLYKDNFPEKLKRFNDIGSL